MFFVVDVLNLRLHLSGENIYVFYVLFAFCLCRRFISTFSGNTNVNDESNTESMRTRLDAVTFDQSTIKNSPNTLMSSARRPNNQYQETSSNNHRSMTEILNEPLNTNYYEIIADEVAEIVSKHTYNMRVDDSDTGIVVLKPGSSANASNSTSLAQSS